MSHYNGCGCGGHMHNSCNSCTSHNEIQQAVNDALAFEKENLEQYETNAAQSASDAANEAAKAAASASASAQSQTNAETAAGTAVATSKVVTDTAVVLEETAEAIKAAQSALDDRVSALQTKPVYFEVSEPTSVLTLPESTLAFNVRSIYVASGRQDVGYGFEFDKTTQTITLAKAITAEQIAETEEGYVLVTVICDLASSDDPTSLAIVLASNAGASLVGTSTGITIELALKARPTYEELAADTGASLLGYLGFKAPEWYGAAGDGVTNDTAVIQALISVPGAKVYLSKVYLVTAGELIPAAGVKIFGPGKLIGITTESFIWSFSNRASNYPVIWVTAANVTIESLTIESPYEAIQAASGGDNLRIFNVKGGGTSTTRASSSAFVFFNVNNVYVDTCECAYTGAVATWNGSDIQEGGCDGIDFGAIHGIRITNTYCHDVGRNGINWYGASNVIIANCRQNMCGQSGIQPGPHPNYKTATIIGNDATYCCADAIDCRYTGSTPVKVDLNISNCTSDWIGMLYGDTNYISDDGTGGVTLAMVYNVNISNIISNNASGAIMWMEGCHNVTYNNIQGFSEYTRYGMGFFTSSYNISLSNFNIICKGPALWHGGSSTFSNFKVTNSYFESIDSYAFLMPNNTLSGYQLNNVKFRGYKVININFPTESVTVEMLGTTESAVYLGNAYVRHSKLAVNGTTSATLVQVGVGTGVIINNSELINAGVGASLSLVSAVGFNLLSSLVWNTGSGGGHAMTVSGGQNESVIAYSDLYSASGKWMESTAAAHTRFLTIANRENGAVAATWTSITNVLDMGTTQRA